MSQERYQHEAGYRAVVCSDEQVNKPSGFVSNRMSIIFSKGTLLLGVYGAPYKTEIWKSVFHTENKLLTGFCAVY
jgi:hypothetical protein